MINPTWFERLIGARINLKICRWYVGTGHIIMEYHDTDDELSSDEE